jgi:uncharacterized membrane protein
MKRGNLIYFAFIAFMFLLCASIVAVPLIAFSDENTARGAYAAFSPLCHQKISRSHCVFHDELGYYIADCTLQNGQFAAGDRDVISVEQNCAVGYKFPVCSRDVGLYFGLLLGAAAYPFARKIEDRNIPPAVYLIIALVPIALDGGVQFISDLGLLPFIYESTNLTRIVTGFISGFAAAFYLIPLFMNLFGKD